MKLPESQAGDLGVYIHVPFCKHACPYCDFYKMELRDRPAAARLEFPALVQREWESLRRQIDGAERRIDTLYFGGGTPSTLDPARVAQLIRAIGPPPDAEVTLEANPENLTASRARQWHEAGINRLSIGVQSFQPADLRLLERLHTPETIVRAVEHACAAGFANISIDLMFALPGQTMAGWMENLRQALALRPDHISFYGLTYHENTAFIRWLEEGRLVELPEDLQAEMYRRGAALLEDAGFEHYEISNFARPGHRSRHNQRYWRRRDVVGLGPGAHSSVGRQRWRNPDDLDAWAAAIAAGRVAHEPVEELDAMAAAGELLFTGLRTIEGILRRENERLYEACRRFAADAGPGGSEWLVVDNERVGCTREGWLVSDALIERILRFL